MYVCLCTCYIYTRQDNEQASLDANLTNSRCYLSETDREKQENLEYTQLPRPGLQKLSLRCKQAWWARRDIYQLWIVHIYDMHGSPIYMS